MNLADQHNQRMVDRMIADGSLWSAAVTAALRATPRHRFLERVFIYQPKRECWRELITRDPSPETLRLLYTDRALITSLGGAGLLTPISSSSQPSLMAQMLQDLDAAPGQRVLEIGAGTGYNAALIAHITGSEVISLDVDREVLSQAWDHLRAFPDRQVRLQHADGRHGYAEGAPYDRIMVTASTPELERDWLEQLAPGGRLLAPLTLAPGLEFTVVGSVQDGVFEGRLTRAAYFMPLRCEGETGTSHPPGRFAVAGEVQACVSPWDGWFQRRRLRQSWNGFGQSLAFFGFLRGLQLHFRSLETDPCIFGISQGDSVCWLGRREWHFNDEAGRQLACDLWEAFLAVGGPWPTDYRLRLSHESPQAAPDGKRCFIRQGPTWWQTWELPEVRQRPAWM